MEKTIRVKLKPEYQNKLFTQLLNQYGIQYLMKRFRVTHSVIYHYQNNLVGSISSDRLDLILHMLQPPLKEVLNNVISLYDGQAVIDENLLRGRDARRKCLLKLREEIPIVRSLFSLETINFEKWFFSYIQLSFRGIRTYELMSIDEDKFSMRCFSYSKSVKKEFIHIFPRFISVDEYFQYFFGLWVGDRIGSGRFGVVNKNRTLNFETASYLKKIYQEPIFDLHVHKDVPIPQLDFPIDSIYIQNTDHQIKGWAVWVYSPNGTLFRFFDYLTQDLDVVLSLLPQREIFFAGLFDAEGNVNIQNHCLKWACMDSTKIPIYEKYLKEWDLFDRYDGCCLITRNILAFDKFIFPYIKHSQKRKDFDFMLFRNNLLPLCFKKVLILVGKLEGSTQNELAKALNRDKIYAQLRILELHGYIEKRGYPYKVFLTIKGLKELESGGKDINNDHTNPLSSAAVNQ